MVWINNTPYKFITPENFLVWGSHDEVTNFEIILFKHFIDPSPPIERISSFQCPANMFPSGSQNKKKTVWIENPWDTSNIESKNDPLPRVQQVIFWLSIIYEWSYSKNITTVPNLKVFFGKWLNRVGTVNLYS